MSIRFGADMTSAVRVTIRIARATPSPNAPRDIASSRSLNCSMGSAPRVSSGGPGSLLSYYRALRLSLRRQAEQLVAQRLGAVAAELRFELVLCGLPRDFRLRVGALAELRQAECVRTCVMLGRGRGDE